VPGNGRPRRGPFKRIDRTGDEITLNEVERIARDTMPDPSARVFIAYSRKLRVLVNRRSLTEAEAAMFRSILLHLMLAKKITARDIEIAAAKI
jgi:hypothetical protein